VKSLRRWIKAGPVRKYGSGKKILDPTMEKELFKWCIKAT